MTLMIATPLYGSGPGAAVSRGYHEAVVALVKEPGIHVDRLCTDTDLVRARSRALNIAYEHKFDHLLFWDADVLAPVGQVAACIQAMLRSGHDLVAANYPRKRLDWNRVAHAIAGGMQPTAENLEASAYEDVVHGLDTSRVERECSPARYVHMGFTLISRACMQQMIEAPQNAHLRFRDFYEGAIHTPTALFALVINEQGLLLSEDHSFCERYSWLGGQPWVYLGPGAHLQHAGAHVYGRAA